MKQLISKEIYLNLYEIKLQILSVTLIVLTSITAIISSIEYKDRLFKYNLEKKLNIENISNNKVYATIKPIIIRKPTSLSIICKGINNEIGNKINIDPLYVQYETSQIIENNPYLSEFCFFDISFIFLWLLSLIGLLLSYDTFSKEIENGTMNLVLANRLSIKSVFFAKFISLSLLIFIIVIFSFIALSLVFLLTPWIEFNLELTRKMASLMITATLYSFFWISLGMLFSVIYKKSSISLISCLTTWVFLILIIPGLLRLVIGTSNFLSENDRIDSFTHEVMSGYWDKNGELWEDELNPLIHSLKFMTFGGSPGWEPIWGLNDATLEATKKYYEELNLLKEDISNKIVHKINTTIILPTKTKLYNYNIISNFFPTTLFENQFMRICGTSYKTYLDLLENSFFYRNQVLNYYKDKNVYNSTRWFTPEDVNNYPFSLNHHLKPANPNSLTDKETEKLIDYYNEKRTDSKFLLALSDFPINDNLIMKPEKNTIANLLAYLVIVVQIWVLLLFSYKRLTKS